MSNVQPSERNTQMYLVLDGGALVHRVKWLKGATYREIATSYVSYVHQHYGPSCIVFDGYKQSPSVKDHEHQEDLRRHVQIFDCVNLCKLIITSKFFYQMSTIKVSSFHY